MKSRKWLWSIAAVLPLAGLPLIAQETAPPAPASTPPAPAPTGAKPADANSAAAATADEDEDEEADAAAAEAQRPADERMSADNNISFPVDI